MQMRIGQTDEVVEILCGVVGWMGMRVDVGIDPYESHKVGNPTNFIRQIFNGR